MDLPIDEEISQTYAQTILVEHNKITTYQDLEPNSPTNSSFVSLFKVELLLAASAASDELFDSEGIFICFIYMLNLVLFYMYFILSKHILANT